MNVNAMVNVRCKATSDSWATICRKDKSYKIKMSHLKNGMKIKDDLVIQVRRHHSIKIASISMKELKTLKKFFKHIILLNMSVIFL